MYLQQHVHEVHSLLAFLVQMASVFVGSSTHDVRPKHAECIIYVVAIFNALSQTHIQSGITDIHVLQTTNSLDKSVVNIGLKISSPQNTQLNSSPVYIEWCTLCVRNLFIAGVYLL